MLTLLFALAAIWTLFWFVMLMLDWGDRTSMTDSDALCSTCANAIKPGSSTVKSTNAGSANAQTAKAKTASTESAKAATGSAANSDNNNANAKSANDSVAKKPATTSNVTDIKAARSVADSIVKKPVADKHDQANVTPLFEKPDHSDDLKTIKGIGVVMERTLNDLGITTFKQLAGFKQADVKMVSDVLSESKAGFGDRIERDEWVDQAKVLVKKAS